MKLILRADVDHLGRLGEVVTVKAGYGRNYLVPQGLAMPATEGNIKAFELERKKLQAEMDALKSAAETTAAKLADAQVVIRVRVGEGDKLYGSVTSSNIVDALAEMGIELDRKKIVLADPIRALGLFVLPVKLHADVPCEVKVGVVRHDWVEGDPIEVVETVEEEIVPEEVVEEVAEEAADDAEQAEEESAE